MSVSLLGGGLMRCAVDRAAVRVLRRGRLAMLASVARGWKMDGVIVGDESERVRLVARSKSVS
jgi:hypothetical protein